jgi:hypothetical protein
MTARRFHILAPFVPVALEPVQILAGMVKWAASRGLIVRDFDDLPESARSTKDLGGWLPNSTLKARHEGSRRHTPFQRR